MRLPAYMYNTCPCRTQSLGRISTPIFSTTREECKRRVTRLWQNVYEISSSERRHFPCSFPAGLGGNRFSLFIVGVWCVILQVHYHIRHVARHTAQRTTAESYPPMTSLVSLVFFVMKLFYLSDLDVEAHDAHCRVVNIITCSGVVLRIPQLYAQLGDTDHKHASVNADGSPRRYKKKKNMQGTPCVVLSRHYNVLTRSLGCCAHDCSIYTNLYNSTIVTLGQVCATMYSCTIVI